MSSNRIFTVCTEINCSSDVEKRCLQTTSSYLSKLWHQRNAIPHQASWRADDILELIHADLCGHITPASSSGKRYFLNLIDDFSRKGWIYLLTVKSEAFEKFKIFRNMMEKEINKNLKCLRIDRGGEFNYVEFNQYCQDNGVAKRRNRTIMNMVRSLLSAKKMPKLF
ncbi:hypothetical protein LIER_26542 [Lithospermum erythrorhizon]|uniref:Integrase catalytic domain-containing protein n=1 Tax=Lithospermum erythrorhizon TaxID=34254 RepID=A0AAV3R8R4_LITER